MRQEKIWPLHPTVIELQEEKEGMALQLFPTIWKLIYTQIPGIRLLLEDEKNPAIYIENEKKTQLVKNENSWAFFPLSLLLQCKSCEII